ncbi:hypothetical protein FOA52_013307 [Chlamydomonas sp. UWO 241]|nr:hypothetical protein FOA52_013307 [Chlamydomonas sp. UWO 241]
MGKPTLLTALLVSAALIGGTSAAFDNGGVCTFPYCGCLTKWGRGAPEPDCLDVSVPVISANGMEMTWTVNNVCPPSQSVLSSSCAQDLFKIEFNTFVGCRFTKTTAKMTWGGVTTPVQPTFDGNGLDSVQCVDAEVQVLKMTNLGLTYADLYNNPVTFAIMLDPIPGIRKCPTFGLLLNRTANPPGELVSMALFSSDNDCCALGPPPSALPVAFPPFMPADQFGYVATLMPHDANGNTFTVEFVIGDACRGAINSVTSTGPSKPLLPSYSRLAWPARAPDGWTGINPLQAKIVGMDPAGQSLDFTITLKGNNACNTVSKFLYNGGQLWYAAFGDSYKPDGCCGTSAIN